MKFGCQHHDCVHAANMRVLHLLAAASDLSQFCSVAGRNFQNQISSLHEQTADSFGQRWELTIALTQALAKGLQLYVGSSTPGSPVDSSRVKQHEDGNSSCNSSGGKTGRTSFKQVQKSHQHLLVLAAAVTHWWARWSHDVDDRSSMATAYLNAGLPSVLPDALQCAAAHAEQMRQQLEQQLAAQADTLIKQQPSSTQLRKAAQPLNEMLDLIITLLNLWTACPSLPRPRHATATGATEITTAALHTAAGLSKAAAAVTAAWRSESVLQACLPAAPSTSIKLGSTRMGIPRLISCTTAAASFELQCAILAQQSSTQPCAGPAPTAAVVTAASLDGVLQLVLTHVALVVAHMHEAQQGKPSAPLPDGTTHNVPANHKALLQAACIFRISLQNAESKPVNMCEVPEHYFTALDWALQQLLCHLQEQAAAADSQHTGCSTAGSSSTGSRGDSQAADTSSSQASTAPAGTPQPDSTNSSGALVASMQSMRLLQHLPALLAELVSLQPQLSCLTRVLKTSAYCLSISKRLQLAANKQQPSQVESCTISMMSSGSAIMRGLFKSCLKVLVPVQQQLATPCCSAGSAAATISPQSQHDVLLNNTTAQAGADPGAVDCCQEAKSLAGPVFQLLAHSMAGFDPHQVRTAAWLPRNMRAGTVFSRLEAGVRHGSAKEPAHTSASVVLAFKALELVRSAVSQQLPGLHCNSMLECVSDSSKSPALLSLLFSCVKRLQHCSGGTDADVARLGRARLFASIAAAHLATKLISRAAADPHHVASIHEHAASNTSDCSAGGSSSSCAGSLSGSDDSSGHSHAAEQPETPVAKKPCVVSTAWLLLAGRALYTTGVALQAVMHSLDCSSSSAAGDDAHQSTQPHQAPCRLWSWAAYNQATHLPELWLPILQECIVQLGSTLQQLAAPDGHPAYVQGSKQLCVVLGRRVLQAHTQLVAASAAAAGSACELAQGRMAAAAESGHTHERNSTAAQRPEVLAAWQQLRSTGNGNTLADSLLKFSSLLCAALPTRFCCNEPNCSCFDRPSELQLAAGKGSQCSACGAARYCGAADQHKHWKQHKHVCRAISAPDAAAGQAKQRTNNRKKGQRQGTSSVPWP